MLETVLRVIEVIASVAIALFTYWNIRLIKNIEKRDDDYKQQTADLFKAIVRSNLVAVEQTSSSPNANMETKINLFKKHYDGIVKVIK